MYKKAIWRGCGEAMLRVWGRYLEDVGSLSGE